jgi:hypothetical protein
MRTWETMPDMSRIFRTCAVGLIAVVPFATTAEAKAPSKKAVKSVYRDCGDGKINKKHPRAALKKAKRTLPADLKQYTGCKKAINKALKKKKKSGTGYRVVR